MSGAAAKPARIPQLTRQQAIDIINSMPYLVCMSPEKLINRNRHNKPPAWYNPEGIYDVEFEVFYGSLSYKFERQRFRVIREISRAEYQAAAPWACASCVGGRVRYYEIHTD